MSGLIVGLALGFVGGVIAGEKFDLYYRGRQAYLWVKNWIAFR